MSSPALAIGAVVRHRTMSHRGTGRVQAISRTLLRGQSPKLFVVFERGYPVWCFPDDLVVVAP